MGKKNKEHRKRVEKRWRIIDQQKKKNEKDMKNYISRIIDDQKAKQIMGSNKLNSGVEFTNPITIPSIDPMMSGPMI
jgi:uncharacterized membrane-anchored protein